MLHLSRNLLDYETFGSLISVPQLFTVHRNISVQRIYIKRFWVRSNCSFPWRWLRFTITDSVSDNSARFKPIAVITSALDSTYN